MNKTPKKIYVKSDWQPDHGTRNFEATLDLFTIKLTSAHNNTQQQQTSSNLNTIQKNILNSIWNNKDIVILVCDKNLGPAVMSRTTYIKEVLNQHLEDKAKTYRKMTDREATSRLKAVSIRLNKIVENKLPKPESDYFTQSQATNKKYRIPQFYGNPTSVLMMTTDRKSVV